MKQTLVVFTIFVFTLSFGLIAQQQTADGGYIIAGSTESYTNGGKDILVYKLSPAGAKEWRKNFGGEFDDFGRYIRQTADGGYIVCGSTDSYTNGPFSDFLLYKLSGSGAKQWRKNLGGYYQDVAYSVQPAADGGYIVAGETYSYVSGAPGSNTDFLLYKLDASGVKQWRKNFGGADYDSGYEVQCTADGGYVVAGYSYTYTHGGADFLIYKLNAAGQKQWRKNLGSEDRDMAFTIQQTSDGGYVVMGYKDVYDTPSAGKTAPSDRDFLVYRLDASGAKLWRKTYGGDKFDIGRCVRSTSDGGFVLSGESNSYTSGNFDALVYKIDGSGAKQWRKNYGGSSADYGDWVFQTTDGGYVIFGTTASYVHGTGSDIDLLIYKVDASGQKQWRKNYGGINSDITGWR
jgi:hypothetical protein